MTKNEAKIKFTAETGEFNDQIKQSESTLKELRSELKLNSAQMKTAGDSTETLKERQKILAKELEASRSKTEALSQKVEKAKEIYGENSEEVKKLKTQLNNAKTAEEKIKAEIEQTNDSLGEQEKAFEDTGDKAETLGDKLSKVGQAMTVVSAGIVAAGAASIAAFNEVDEGADNAIKATGATGEAAAELEESYKNVANSIVGDFGDLGNALGEVRTRFGFTGETLEAATKEFVKFSEVTGMDVTTAVEKVSRYMGDAGIDSSEYASVLDNLTAAAQASGVSMDTLTENLTKYGAPMRALGFDTEESIAIFSSWEKAGVNTEIAFSGMKKAIGTWSKEGKDSREEFKKTLAEIAACPDIASATTKAIEVFGQKAGPDLADAIQGGRFEYEDMLAVIEGSKGTLDGTFDATVDGGYELELAMQSAKVALGEVGNSLSSTLAPIVEGVASKLQSFANWWGTLSEKTQKTIFVITGIVAAIGPALMIIGKVVSVVTALRECTILATAATKLQAAGQWLLNAAMSANPITWVILAIVALIAIFAVLWNKCEGFRNFWINLWNTTKEIAAAAWQAIKGFFINAWNVIKGVWSTVTGFFTGIWNGIKTAFSAVGSWFGNIFSNAKQGVQNAWSSVTGFFTNIKDKIVNAFSNVKEKLCAPFEKAKNAIKNIADKIKGFFSGEIKMPKIKKPKFSITPAGWKIGDLLHGVIPKLKITWHAKAMNNPMILNRATIFGQSGDRLLGGGEAGSEMIGGVNTVMRMIQNAVDRSIRGADIASLANAVEDLANRPIEIDINGRQFALATAGDTDSVNGHRNVLKSRGLEL